MLAYKFLGPGAVAPFTGFRWPPPGPSGPGEWVQARPGELARYGVHACAPADLPFWPDAELWTIELGGAIVAGVRQLVAARGRLVRRVARWDDATAARYGAACAWRARELAAAALARAGLAEEAAALRAWADLPGLAAGAGALAGAAPPSEPRGLAAYVAGAALRAQQGRAPEASLHHANLGAALGGPPGAESERAWQAHWLIEELGTPALPLPAP